VTEPETDNAPPAAPESPYRREFLWAMGGLGAATAAAFAGWGGLEVMVPPGTADEWHKSTCRFCGTGCTIRVGMRDGEVVDIRGHEDGHNKGVICVKGSMLRSLPKIEGRLTTPMIRKNGELVPASWDEALDLIAGKFKEVRDAHGPDALAFYGSGQLFTEESYTANKLFKAGLRTNNVDGNPRLCMASAASGYVTVFGKDEPPGSYEDIDHADFFFIFGANPYECHPPLWERVQRRRALRREAFVVCVDPRRSETAKRSDLHLPVIAGTDLLLLNAMAHVIIEDGLTNNAFIDKHVRFSHDGSTVDLAAFRALMAEYSPENVEARLGIGAGVIRHVAHRFAKAKASMSLWTMGVNQRTQGTRLNIMLNALHLLTGQICRPGATPFSVTGQPNACGGVRDTGSLSHALPAGRVVANAEHRAEVEKLWGVAPGTISPNPGHHAVSLFRAMESGQVKAALIMCTNPGQSMPDSDRYAAAMRNCFTVVSEIVADSETAKAASVLLPAALWVEKQGVLGQGERRYQLVDKLLEPPGECRSDLWMLVELAKRLGLEGLIKAHTPQAVWDEWRQFSTGSAYDFSGMTYDRLRALPGLQWPCPTEQHPGTVRRFVEGSDPLVKPGQGVQFYGHKDGRAHIPFCPYVPSPEQPSPEFPLYLTTGRVLEQWHTGTMTGRITELRDAAGPARFTVSAVDASRRGVESGDMIFVTSRFGDVQGRAVIDADMRPGLMFAAFYDARLLVNKVVADHVDPVSREPEYKLTAVQFRKAGA
jgi:nitrate reductase NapA